MLSGALAGLVVGLADAVLVLRGEAAGRAALFAGSVDLVLGGLVGLAMAIVFPSLRARLPADLRAHLDDPAADTRVAAGLLGGAAALVLLAAFVAAFHLAVASGFQRKQLAAIALGVVAALGALVAGTALPALTDAARPLASRLPRPRTRLVLGGLTGGTALVAVAVLGRMDWRALDAGMFLGAPALAVLALTLGHLLGGRPIARAGLLAGALGLLGLGGVGSSAALPASSFRALDEHGLLGKPALSALRALSDADGDGYAARFGGGDCNDRDAAVHPGAEDIPGDGIDQDCEDGDARVGAERPGGKPTGPKTGTLPGPGTPRAPATPAIFSGNLVLITIDALRADRTAAGGGKDELSPSIDALAARSVAFTRAHSHAPNTPRSFPATLLSRAPSLIRWQNPTLNYPPLEPGQRTVFDGLKDAGYAPIGIFSHHYFKPERGIHGAFAEWTNDGARTIADSNEDVASPRIVPRVIERLARLAQEKRKFVLWTHLFEPHSKYVEHAEYPVKIGGLPGLEKKYDMEVRYVDRWVGKIVGAIQDLGLSETTAIVVFADHGECFGEHNRKYFHGEHLYEEVLHVPLIVHVPGIAPRRVDELVGLWDLGPTLLELVGAAAEPSFRGRSLVPALKGDPLEPRPVVAELMPQTSFKEHHRVLLDGTWKLYQRVGGAYELYDLGRDPGEKQNLAAREAGKLAELKAKLQQLLR